ncbi:MAG: chorismate mutase [Alphaproteobacteria bacterium]
MTKDTNPVLDMTHIRTEIDRVDNALLSLIAERLQLAKEVRRAKSGARVWRPSREESLVRHLAENAADTSPHLVSRIWAELVSASLALQGPMRLHIALEGDALEVWTLVRDRFGAAIPALSYPTASSALAAAYAEDEGVAVLPSPGGMNSWWSALCKGGAAEDMSILAGLPRIGNAHWPRAVAVATADRQPSGRDITLIAVRDPKSVLAAELAPTLRAEAGDNHLVTVDGFLDESSDAFKTIAANDSLAKIIGCLPKPLPEGRAS